MAALRIIPSSAAAIADTVLRIGDLEHRSTAFSASAFAHRQTIGYMSFRLADGLPRRLFRFELGYSVSAWPNCEPGV
jgi:hypothetical protein